MTGTEESTLALGGPNITVNVCVSLKRLLIVTFNIKAIRIQSSKCSHPVKLSFGGIRSLRFINQPNLYVFKKTLMITLRKMTLQKLLLHIFHVTTLSFSDITLIVTLSASKVVGGVTCMFLPHDVQFNRQIKYLSLQSKLWFIL